MRTVSEARGDKQVPAAAAVAALIAGLSALWIGFRIGGLRLTRDVDDTVTALAALLATLACGRAGLRHQGRLRVTWSLLAGACLCWTVAEVTWGVYDLVLRAEVPVPSWADVGYLAAIPIAVIGLLRLPAMPSGRRHRMRWLADGVIVAAALGFVSWTLVLGPVWHATDLSTIGGIVAVAYPLGDVMMVFFVVVAVRRMSGGESAALWLLLAGLLMMALSDSAYSYLVTTNSYSSGGLLDVGWIAAYLTISVAAVASKPQEQTVTRAAASSAPSLLSFVAPFVPALMALGAIGLELQLGRALDAPAMAFALVLVTLVLVRQLLLANQFVKESDDAETLQIRHIVSTALGRRGPASAIVHPTGARRK